MDYFKTLSSGWRNGRRPRKNRQVRLRKNDARTLSRCHAYIGVVEGYPGIDEVVGALAEAKPKSKTRKVLLKPFMIVAGDHALNDMAGDDEESWKSALTAKKYQAIPLLKGLGSNDGFAEVFVNHIRDEAKEAGIPLP
jgi:sirohydrochlorin cobaltochelatase